LKQLGSWTEPWTEPCAAAAGLCCGLVQFPRPEYVAADLSKVKLADALATTSFNPKEPTLFTIGRLAFNRQGSDPG
jgi:hypothetical protein